MQFLTVVADLAQFNWKLDKYLLWAKSTLIKASINILISIIPSLLNPVDILVVSSKIKLSVLKSIGLICCHIIYINSIYLTAIYVSKYTHTQIRIYKCVHIHIENRYVFCIHAISNCVSVSNRGHCSTGQSSLLASTTITPAGSSISSINTFWCDFSWKTVMFLRWQRKQGIHKEIFTGNVLVWETNEHLLSKSHGTSDIPKGVRGSIKTLAVNTAHMPSCTSFLSAGKLSLLITLSQSRLALLSPKSINSSSLRACFGCQWTWMCSRQHSFFFQPALFPVIPWMYFGGCNIKLYLTVFLPTLQLFAFL